MWYNPLFKLTSPLSVSLDLLLHIHTLLPHPQSLPFLHYQHQQTRLGPSEIAEALCPQVQTFLFFLPSPSFLLSFFSLLASLSPLCCRHTFIWTLQKPGTVLLRAPWWRCILLRGKEGEGLRESRKKGEKWGSRRRRRAESGWLAGRQAEESPVEPGALWYRLGSQGVLRQVVEEGCEIQRKGRGG